jgi:hypothetical protein
MAFSSMAVCSARREAFCTVGEDEGFVMWKMCCERERSGNFEYCGSPIFLGNCCGSVEN